jgi:hypothetical protein
MRRRDFIKVIVGSVAAWPLAVSAQQASRVARIGFLGSTFASPWASRIEAFRSGLSLILRQCSGSLRLGSVNMLKREA